MVEVEERSFGRRNISDTPNPPKQLDRFSSYFFLSLSFPMFLFTSQYINPRLYTMMGSRLLLGPAQSLALRPNIISITDVSPLTSVLASGQGSRPHHSIRRVNRMSLLYKWLSESKENGREYLVQIRDIMTKDSRSFQISYGDFVSSE